MQEPIQQKARTEISLNGLEDVFDVDTTVTTESSHPDMRLQSPPGQGLTIKQASEHYGLAVPTVRLKIKTGEIAALKVNGPKGPEWRIFPDGLPSSTVPTVDDKEEGHADSSVIDASYESDRRVAEGFHQANINLAAVLKANQELVAKLEASTYRNGYLEAQLASAETQLKLLPDYQAQASNAALLKKQVSELESELHRYKTGWLTKFAVWLACNVRV